jgi:hypothetical protein
LHLSPEDIAAAEACGISFLTASDAQVQRLAMQRKVFYHAGAPILATRGDGLFETVGTLQQLIEEGRRQQRDLSQWLEAAAPDPEAASEPEAAGVAPVPTAKVDTPVPEPAPLVEPVVAADALPTPQVEPAAAPPKRPRQKRRRPEPATEEMLVTAEIEAEIEAPQAADAEEATADLLLPVPSRPLGRAAVRTPTSAVEAPDQDRGKRWLMAGAARRGRAGKHWSTRQR